MADAASAGAKFDELVSILGALRGPEGCPWDRARTDRDIRDYFLEEVYEAVEALDAGDPSHLAEELGDVLMEVVFLSRLHEERREFTVADALDRVNAKMVARHPHVFGPRRGLDPPGVAEAWHEGKSLERGGASIVGDPAASTPALLEAFLIGRKVSAVGFDWPDVQGVLAKVREEAGELEDAVRTGDPGAAEEELGDLLFALANLGRKLDLNPELAARRANAKFVRRFRALEEEIRASGRTLGRVPAAELDAVWDALKSRE